MNEEKEKMSEENMILVACLFATPFPGLHRWAFYRALAVKHAAIARLGFQQGFSVSTFVKEGAGISRHDFLLAEITNRTGYCGLKYGFCEVFHCVIVPLFFRPALLIWPSLK